MSGTRSEVIAKLQDANQKLRAEVRALRKRLHMADDQLALLQDIWQDEIADLKKARRDKIKKKKEPLCPICGNPTLDIKDIGGWILIRCEGCDHFERNKKEI